MNQLIDKERLISLFDDDSRNDTAIADALGVSKQAVSSWRNGTRSPTASAIKRIADVYHVPIEWLFGVDSKEETPVSDASVWIGKQIRYYRKLKNMTQVQLADAINQSHSSITMYETGYRQPPIDIMNRIANVLEISPALLLSDDPLPEEQQKPSTSDFALLMDKLRSMPDEDISLLLAIANRMTKE
jgi:transcriptional regulator with XRE-family HTH domain